MAGDGDDVVVVGGGVIGLTTAICAAEAGLAVQVWTADPPSRTTSAVAAALLGPAIGPPDDPLTRWTVASDAVFRRLAEDPATGVRVGRGRLVSNWGDEPPPWAPNLPGYAPTTAAERAGFRLGFWVDIPVADMRAYLDYLTGRLLGAGGRLVQRRVSALAEGLVAAPVVANCTGVGARELADDPEVQAVKGQHVIVANPGIETFFYEGGAAGGEWTGFFPHGDRVVLGGIGREGDWSLDPDPDVSAGIVARCAAVEPALASAPVLGVEVGLRPGRPAPRLARETVDGGHIVHNYGHGGVGVSVSWGCARDALALLRDG
jgi:D-amino-acid oxidase